MCAKLNTRDLIIDVHEFGERNKDVSYEHVYTLVCRADLNKANSWNLAPEVDIATFYNSNNANEYRRCVSQVRRYQALKYPELSRLKTVLQSEMDMFHKMIAQLHSNTK